MRARTTVVALRARCVSVMRADLFRIRFNRVNAAAALLVLLAALSFHDRAPVASDQRSQPDAVAHRMLHSERDALRPMHANALVVLHAGSTTRRAFDSRSDGARELRLPVHHASQQRALGTTERQIHHATRSRLQQTGVIAGGTCNLPPPSGTVRATTTSV